MRFAIAVVLCFAAAQSVAAPLPVAFTRALAAAGIPRASVALVIQRVDATRPTLDYRADAPMNPASVMKLVTSLAALARLGPDFRWHTDVWAQGPIVQRTLRGDLVIKGDGDPTLTLERLWLMQQQLRARGIDKIDGSLVLDTQAFDLPPADPAAFDGDPLAPYNAAPGALVANYGASLFRVMPLDDRVAVVPAYLMPQLRIASQLVPDDAACGDWQDALHLQLTPDPEPTLTVAGRYPRACGERSLALNVFTPAQNFATLFRALWLASGGVLLGDTRSGSAPTTPPLLRFDSIPLADALRAQNKYSSNLMARNLYLTVGAEIAGAPATLGKSERALRDWLAEQNVAAPELVLDNGAGLSRSERISAGTLAQLLAAAADRATFSEFESSLPLAGVDGTLRRRFTGTDLVGEAHLKTGSLRDVRALAGYVHTLGNERLVFVLLINDARADQAAPAQQALLEWARHLPAARSR